MTAVYVLIGVAVVLILWFVAAYNGLVRLRNQVKNAWAQIDVQLKRRYDLIPNLLETVKGYMKHEREVLENVTKARAAAMGATGPAAAGVAEGQVQRALADLRVVMENYPELKANENAMQLQEELTSTENKIGFARQFYNDSVMQFNNKTEMVPTNIVAGMFSFQKAELFEIPEEQKEAPKVSFD
ncbi:MAG: LemA family protein [Candidatus Brocadiae bacterium]|nr:LemA family protein [Candidatus Brocadiia bacterium]